MLDNLCASSYQLASKPIEYKDNILQSYVLDTVCLLIMMVGGRFVTDDDLRLLIYMAASRVLTALTFSHRLNTLKGLNQ